MCTPRITGRGRTCCLIFLLFTFVLADSPQANTIPDVDFTIVRLDYQTRVIKGYYELTHPYRKSLPAEGYTEVGNIFYRYVPPSDFGYITVKSRLTGELLVNASCVWMGRGTFNYPPDSLFSTSYQDGYSNPAPDSYIYLPIHTSSPQHADSAWSAVEGTDIIHRLALLGSYEVVIFDHFYTLGASDPTTAEWIVVAFTHPPAPDDMALVELNWPKTLVTRNVDFIPEIVVHNFSDQTLSARVNLTMTSTHGFIGEYDVLVDALPADASRTIYFNPIAIPNLCTADLGFVLKNPFGSPWIDAYPDNNGWQQGIEVIDLPVFRRVSYAYNLGSVPMYGKALDFDDDGDFDIVQLNHPSLKFWQQDDAGAYVDITDQSAISLPTYARDAIAADFNGDGYSDIIVVSFRIEPEYYLGDGTGVFADAIASSGLSGVIGYYDVDAFDKDNDGDQDLIFQSHGQELIFENDGGGYFSDVTASSGLVDPAQTEEVTVGDINGDGFMDLVLANWDSPSGVFINNGSGQFSEISGPWSFEHARDALIFDFDGDGLQDILFARFFRRDDPSFLYRNLGELSFVEVSGGWGGLPGAFSAAAADFDDNGSLDLIIEDFDELRLFLYEGGVYVDHTELFVDRIVDLTGSLRGLGSWMPQYVDLDGDGDLDVYSLCAYYENQGLSGRYSDDPPSASQSCLLHQNYPNPFNPTTTISFDLPQAEHITLSVYNVAGELVSIVIDQHMTEGHKEVEWSARDSRGDAVSSGIYFYRLVAGGFVQTKKMVLLK